MERFCAIYCLSGFSPITESYYGYYLHLSQNPSTTSCSRENSLKLLLDNFLCSFIDGSLSKKAKLIHSTFPGSDLILSLGPYPLLILIRSECSVFLITWVGYGSPKAKIILHCTWYIDPTSCQRLLQSVCKRFSAKLCQRILLSWSILGI